MICSCIQFNTGAMKHRFKCKNHGAYSMLDNILVQGTDWCSVSISIVDFSLM
jgi:hypothetical protein